MSSVQPFVQDVQAPPSPQGKCQVKQIQISQVQISQVQVDQAGHQDGQVHPVEES